MLRRRAWLLDTRLDKLLERRRRHRREQETDATSTRICSWGFFLQAVQAHGRFVAQLLHNKVQCWPPCLLYYPSGVALMGHRHQPQKAKKDGEDDDDAVSPPPDVTTTRPSHDVNSQPPRPVSDVSGHHETTTTTTLDSYHRADVRGDNPGSVEVTGGDQPRNDVSRDDVVTGDRPWGKDSSPSVSLSFRSWGPFIDGDDDTADDDDDGDEGENRAVTAVLGPVPVWVCRHLWLILEERFRQQRALWTETLEVLVTQCPQHGLDALRGRAKMFFCAGSPPDWDGLAKTFASCCRDGDAWRSEGGGMLKANRYQRFLVRCPPPALPTSFSSPPPHPSLAAGASVESLRSLRAEVDALSKSKNVLTRLLMDVVLQFTVAKEEMKSSVDGSVDTRQQIAEFDALYMYPTENETV